MQIPPFTFHDRRELEAWFPHADWLISVDTAVSQPEAMCLQAAEGRWHDLSLRDYRRKYTVVCHYRTPDPGRLLTISSDFHRLHPDPGHEYVCQVESRMMFDHFERRELQFIVRARSWEEVVRYSMEMCWHQVGDPPPGRTGPASPAPYRPPEPVVSASEPVSPPPEAPAYRRRHLIRKTPPTPS